VIVIGNELGAAAVPLNVAVPFPLSTNPTPPGSFPLSVMAGVGTPVVVTVNESAEPAWKLAALALVIAGACCALAGTAAKTMAPIRIQHNLA
jgi:hypothetical protein